MTLAMMNTHKAYKSLQQAGVEERQAEVLVEIFAEMQQEHSLTKVDLAQAMEGVVQGQQALNQRVDRLEERVDLFEKNVNERFDQVDKRFDQIDKRFEKIDARFDKTDTQIHTMNLDIIGIKKELQWLKRIMMAATCAIVLAASKYIFIS
jgi:archaellum component FlaC